LDLRASIKKEEPISNKSAPREISKVCGI